MTGVAVRLPDWLMVALPVVAAVLALLLVVLTVAAIRRLRAPPPAKGAPPAGPVLALPAPPPIAATVQSAAARLEELGGYRDAIDDVPVFVAIGAGSAFVKRTVPDLEAGGEDLARSNPALLGDTSRVLLGPGGAAVCFEDGLVGSDRWERRWNELMRALMSRRRDQPLDGIVIVFRAEQLTGAGKLDDDALSALGARLYQMILTAQRSSGWRVPIYAVISGCEALTGFAATAAALPADMRRAPFGWTTPYGLDTNFERGWAQEAIDALVARLSVLQTQLLLRSRDAASAEAVLLFPESVAALAAPLAVLLASMLRPSAYHQPFMFRGFYLTGRTADATPDALDAFAPKLFSDWIFPEHVLCQPAQGATTRRQRHIRVAQAVLAASVVLAIAGLVAIRDQRGAVATVQRLIDGIHVLDHQYRTALAASGAPSDGAAMQATPASWDSPAATEQLLELMGGVSLDRLETVLAPLSYLGTASADVEAAIRTGYEVAVLRTVYDRLTARPPAWLGPAVAAETIPPGPLPACTAGSATLADVAAMQAATARIGTYATQLQIYQRLPQRPDIADLKSLLQFTMSITMPANFSDEYYLYETALRGAVARPLIIGDIRTTVDGALRALFARAIAGIYPGSPLARAVDQVQANAVPVESQPGDRSGIDRLQRLDAALRTVRAQAPLAEYDWIASGADAAPIADILDRIGQLSSKSASSEDLAPVSPGVVPVLRNAATDCMQQTRTVLSNAAVFTAVPVLSLPRAGSQDKTRLSPQLGQVAVTLEKFLAQPLVAAPLPAADLLPLSVDAPVLWDPQGLQAAQFIAESYAVFVAQDLPPTLPGEFRDEVQNAAGQRLDRLVDALVARARQRAVERQGAAASGNSAALRDETMRFADAAPILTNLRASLRSAGRLNLAAELDQLTANQALRLLGQVDGLLTAADPYQLADPKLSFWTGAPPLAAPAFGAEGLPELVATLPARRDYVEALSRDYAAPLLAYLQQSATLPTGASTALLTRWQSIATTFDQYHRSAPNSLSRLEQFISAEMDGITLATCRTATAGTVSGADWFAEQLQIIRRAIASRCGGVTYSDSVGQYGDLADAFNRNLAGRFPFGEPSAPDAFAGDVKRFYDRFGAGLPGLRDGLTKVRAYVDAGGVQFLDDLIAVQSALAPMLANPAPNAPLTYDVAVDFRTNVGSDPGANQIIDSSVQAGTQTLSSWSATRSIAWTNGQKVQVTLNWATNAPTIPAASPGPSPAALPAPRVNGLAASYDYGGAWALLRMLAAQRPSASLLAQLQDRRPGTVGFTVPLQRNPAAVSGGDGALTQAEVFMHFGLGATLRTPGQPDKQIVVDLPTFPTAAPLPVSRSAAAITAPRR